ncbi:MAG: hypothetical protein V9H25_18850 [Candidatus Competibacter sp.]
MRRSRVGLAAIADWHNLAAAFWRAARGKGQRDDVRRFRADLNGELARLRESLLDGSVEVGRMRSFHIRDPKPRIIHAPCFRERVLHHAVMAHVGPVLDRALVDDTYACRVGKGALAAVLRAQHHATPLALVRPDRHSRPTSPASTTQTLLALLERRFKDRGLLALLARIVAVAPRRTRPRLAHRRPDLAALRQLLPGRSRPAVARRLPRARSGALHGRPGVVGRRQGPPCGTRSIGLAPMREIACN